MRFLLAVLALAAPVHAPTLAADCGGDGGLRARSTWLETSDHVRLYAIEAGRGRTAVVLLHEGGGNLCEELPYAKTLVAAGLRVVAIDFRNDGESAKSTRHPVALGRDIAAAVKLAHDGGAKRVFLIGASMGGAAAVNNSGGVQLAGVISLSGTRLWPGFGVNEPGPQALRAPLLYLGSRDDGLAPLKQARWVFDHAGSKDKRMVLYDGSTHGWDLVQSVSFARAARTTIVRWIRSHA